jgi:hypothetical protein
MDHAISGLSISVFMFFPGSPLLPPLAGIIVSTLIISIQIEKVTS